MSQIDAPIIMWTKIRVKSVRTMKVRQDSKLVRTTQIHYLALTALLKLEDFNLEKFINPLYRN